MSYAPWPFVIVALASLGFLAKSMGQQNDSLFNRFDDVPRVSVNQDKKGLAAPLGEPSLDASAPMGRFDDYVAPSFDELVNDTNPGRRRVDLRRQSDLVFAQISDVRELDEQPIRSPVEPAVGAGYRFARPSNEDLDTQRRSDTSTSNRGIDRARLDGGAFKTRETSLIKPVPTPFVEKQTKPGESPTQGNVNKRSIGNKIDSALEGATQSVLSSTRTVPTWLTLGLFFSIGANLFLGYIAMNTHSRYQDLVEDMNTSESRLDRQARRRSRADSVKATKRQRDADEAAFLQGGIEV